jgi:acyl carrier protein
MTLESELAEYIRCRISHIEKDSIGEDDDLLSEGHIDSLGIVQLIEYIAERFGVNIGADEIQPENFSSARAIAALIARKQG